MICIILITEENGVDLGRDDLLEIREQHRVGELVGEELDRTTLLAVVGVFLVLEDDLCVAAESPFSCPFL